MLRLIKHNKGFAVVASICFVPSVVMMVIGIISGNMDIAMYGVVWMCNVIMVTIILHILGVIKFLFKD